MTIADTTHVPSRPVTALGAQAPARVRDLRLDFFRGLAMFIILFAHTPGNLLSLWIPARWGFSDATEIFVFCSGMASAIAFGGAFARVGWFLGSARVLFRVWQVYWAHVGLFFATLAMTVYLTDLDITGQNYWGQLNLWPVFVESDKWENSNILLSFMTLRYVPNYFDVLPMYMIVLLLMPLVMALAQVDKRLVAAFVIGIWLLAQDALLQALGLGAWHLAAFIVIANIPLSNIGVRELELGWAADWRKANAALFDKTDFAILRYVHFLSLAYICWVLAGDQGKNLLARGTGAAARLREGLLTVILKVGQQSLAVFVFSMFTARVLGFVMDVIGRGVFITLAVNLVGCALLVAVAYGAGWFKSQPWRQKRATS